MFLVFAQVAPVCCEAILSKSSSLLHVHVLAPCFLKCQFCLVYTCDMWMLEVPEVHGDDEAVPLNKLKASYLTCLDELRKAVGALSGLDGEQLVQKPSQVETVMQAWVACSTQQILGKPDTEYPMALKQAFDGWVVANTDVTKKGFEEKVGQMRDNCKEHLVETLKTSTAAVMPVRFGARHGRSWKENLASDAPFAEVVKVAQPLLKGEVAVSLCSGVGALAKDLAEKSHPPQFCLSLRSPELSSTTNCMGGAGAWCFSNVLSPHRRMCCCCF